MTGETASPTRKPRGAMPPARNPPAPLGPAGVATAGPTAASVYAVHPLPSHHRQVAWRQGSAYHPGGAVVTVTGSCTTVQSSHRRWRQGERLRGLHRGAPLDEQVLVDDERELDRELLGLVPVEQVRQELG